MERTSRVQTRTHHVGHLQRADTPPYGLDFLASLHNVTQHGVSQHSVSQRLHILSPQFNAYPDISLWEACRNVVFKAGCIAKMGPLNELGKQWHSITNLVRNLAFLAVKAICRLFSEETMYPIFGHFKCVEGLHPCRFQHLPPLLTDKYEPSDLSGERTDLKKYRLFMWLFGHPENNMVCQSRTMFLLVLCLPLPLSPFTL